MRAKGVLAAFGCALMLLPCTGSRRCRATGQPSLPAGPDLRQPVWHGNRLFQSGRYAEAAAVYSAALVAARQAGDLRLQARLLNNLGGCRQATFQYRAAMAAYREARRIAARIKDYQTAAGVAANLATVYTQMGELDAAQAAAEQALELAERGGGVSAPLLVRAATLRARQGDWPGAEALFMRSIELAAGQGDPRALALAWNALGYEHLRCGRLGPAEIALLEAFRLRRLGGAPELYLSYRNLALLRAAQGDLPSAVRLMDQALAGARRAVAPVPLWALYYERGRLYARQGRLERGLSDLRVAVEQARRWRLEVLPAEAFRVSLDAGLQQLYGALVETAAALRERTGRKDLAREAFEAAEENRAAGLRALLERGDEAMGSLPAGYGEALAELHAAEAALFLRDSPPARGRLRAARRRLAEIELESGLRRAGGPSFRWDAGGGLLRRTQAVLRPEEAFLAFYLGESAAYRWAVSRRGLEMARLAPPGRIAALSAAFHGAVRSGAAEAPELGRQLYEVLFGGLSPGVRRKRQWLLALDSVLFELPLAALVTGFEGRRPVYLAQRHALEIVPGAQSLARGGAVDWAGRFVGVGDAVYNRADDRWKGSRGKDRRGGFWALLPRLGAAPPEPAIELARLPGSGREIRAAAAQWNRAAPPLLLEGPRASLGALREALAGRPAVLHLAAHVMGGRQSPSEAVIALSLGPDGRPELLGSAAIRSLGRAPALVVLSGCNSGLGPAPPGAGLLGLTRAWLAAGARAVIASLWPTPDDDGELFQAFYGWLRRCRPGREGSAAAALQGAQQEMLARGGRHAAPAYWAAYFAVGTE
jgi:CHAT domain-containing protein/tetratricopeptide (TPR) repeat protein